LTPAEEVRIFRAGASPTARHLAEYLAAAPLTLPVMRLVQRLMLPESMPRDLAEVFLSGLLYRVTPDDRPVAADRILFDFRAGVRPALLTGLRVGSTLTLLDAVSQFVNQRMGTSFDFPALLAGQPGAVPATELGQPFAAVATEVLKALGGRYAALAERLLPAADIAPNTDDERRDSPLRSHPIRRHKGVDVSQPIDDSGERGSGASSRPAIWGEVPPRNPDFTGREDLLHGVRRHLTGSATALLPHTLHGLGGVGKTQLAVEYAYRYEAAYDLVWWVPAEQPALFRQSLTALARRLDLVQPGEADVARALNSVYDALRTGRPYRRWLLVFDNANAPEDLTPFLSNPGGHVLITSRNYNWSGIAHTVEVDVFSRMESVQLLTRRLPDLGEERADRLANLLGDLPLALEQAVSWISATAMPVEEYLDLLEKRTVDTLREGSLSTYDNPVAVVFGLSCDRLAEENPPALQLLELCAFFGAEPISIRLLPVGRYATNLPPVLADTVRDDIQLRRAIREIGRFGLAKVDPSRNSIRVHRLVQAVLRQRLSEEQQAGYLGSIQEILAGYNPGDPTDDPMTWDRHAEIGPHLASSKAVYSDSAEIRNVVLDQIRYLYVTGDYVSSRDLGQLAYDVWTEKLGSHHPTTIVTGRFLANALRTTGDVAATRRLNEQNLATARQALGLDHEHTLAVANSVGADVRLSGDWVRSREIDEDLLVRHRRVFGEDDPNTLRVANNLGVDLRLLGDFRRARELDQDTWNRRRLVLGDEHPDTLFSVTTGLSRDLYGLGLYDEAIELQRRWLPVLRSRLGPDHANVLLALRIHAATLRKAGQPNEALEMAREVVRRRRERYGEDHTETINATLTLFTTLASSGRIAEARLVGEETYAGYRRMLGDDHVFTYVGMTNLAIVLRMAGDYRRAHELDERALRGMTASRVLGPDHPYSICTAINMSNNLAVARDHRAAVDLLTDTRPRALAVLGEKHPEALACSNNLALDLHSVGRIAEARALRDETLGLFQQVLEEDHPDIDAVIRGRRLYCVVDPPPT
jgi:tetratricopeptide (TPR) repeat protein